MIFPVPEDCFYINSADPDERLDYAAFHLGLHRLPTLKPFLRGSSIANRVKFELSNFLSRS